MAQERPNAFTFGVPRTLVGPELKAGDTAPAFKLIDRKGQEVSSDLFKGKPMLISVVPSVDTGVCSLQTRRFDQEAASLGDAITVIGVSADLPFALGRWCGAEGAENIRVLSDHRDMSFGQAFGTYVKELRIDSRAVFVVDKDGVIRYVEYVPIVGNQPNYDAAIAAVREVTA